MFDYYISQLENWAETTIPKIVNQENFLLIVGSFFALGVVTKWLVLHNYNKLIRKAGNINKTNNATLRQIKTKYDSLRQVNHNMENPIGFVQKSLNRCRIMYISINRVNNIINYCTLIIMAVYSIVSYEVYLERPNEITWVQYLIIGSFVAISLEMVNRTLACSDRKMFWLRLWKKAMADDLTRVKRLKTKWLMKYLKMKILNLILPTLRKHLKKKSRQEKRKF